MLSAKCALLVLGSFAKSLELWPDASWLFVSIWKLFARVVCGAGAAPQRILLGIPRLP